MPGYQDQSERVKSLLGADVDATSDQIIELAFANNTPRAIRKCLIEFYLDKIKYREVNRRWCVKLFNYLNQRRFIEDHAATLIKTSIADTHQLGIYALRSYDPQLAASTLAQFKQIRAGTLHFYSRSKLPAQRSDETDGDYLYRIETYGKLHPASRTAQLLANMKNVRRIASVCAPKDHKEFYHLFMKHYRQDDRPADSAHLFTELRAKEKELLHSGIAKESNHAYRVRVAVILHAAESGGNNCSYRTLKKISATPNPSYFNEAQFRVNNAKQSFQLFMQLYLHDYRSGWQSNLITLLKNQEAELKQNGYDLFSEQAYRHRMSVIVNHAEQGNGFIFKNRTCRILRRLSEKAPELVEAVKIKHTIKSLSDRLDSELEQRFVQFLPGNNA